MSTVKETENEKSLRQLRKEPSENYKPARCSNCGCIRKSPCTCVRKVKQ